MTTTLARRIQLREKISAQRACQAVGFLGIAHRAEERLDHDAVEKAFRDCVERFGLVSAATWSWARWAYAASCATR